MVSFSFRLAVQSVTLCLYLCCIGVGSSQAAKLVGVSVLDKDFLMVNISDGDVIHIDEANKTEQVLRYTPELDAGAAEQPSNWSLRSLDDSAYGGGQNPLSCSRKKKLSGHAEMEWVGSDFRYEYTYEHWIYLELPSSLQQGASYTLGIGPGVNSDVVSVDFTFDQFSQVSEAIHVNLVGYSPDAPHKAADLYHWMGSGGARDYSGFEGNPVYLYNVDNQTYSQVGTVQFWRQNGSDVHNYNLTGSDVWSSDFSAASIPGTYRLVVDGVGCSQAFEIKNNVYEQPFTLAVRGYFYMRIGESNPRGLSPPPRTPLYLPGQSPVNTTVYLTTMHPFHPDWQSFASGDKWDRPDAWLPYRKSGSPTNPNAWGGHSDAADWDRHLAHVANIYDMLLPYLMSDGELSDDNLGITESGNGIPDLLDEARNEVDFWLRLRDGQGYSHGLTNPNSSNEFFQAAPTALAAWANAANAAMLADAFRVAGLNGLVSQYRDAAVEAFTYASGLANQMLDEHIYLDEGHLRGRDLKMMAAAHLYNVTGDTSYEDIVNSESVCNGGPSPIQYFYSGSDGINQLYGTAAYLVTPRAIHYPDLYQAMKTQIISEAKSQEADLMNLRPSRRSTYNPPSYWRTAHVVGRTIVAHAIADDQVDRQYFRRALCLEADWGLGRNPLNMIEMTTATTALAAKRSVPEAYTSGRDDNVPGVHPGHTPYMNLSDWWQGMVMAMPTKLYENSFPANVPATWPVGETYFPSRWVFSHTEFTPRQTMKGKLALYGYLYSLAGSQPPADTTLSVSLEEIAGGSGTVSSTPSGIDCGTDCSEVFAGGSTITLTATAAVDSVFTGWSGSCFGTGNSCEIRMDMDRQVTARFEPIGHTFELSVKRLGDGDGKIISSPAGIDCGINCRALFGSSTQVNITPIPFAGSVFAGWSGACSGTGSCKVTMTGDTTVSASFRSAARPPIVIYDDALGENWEDWSWSATVDLSGNSHVHTGSRSANITLEGWGGFSPSLSTASEPIDTEGYESISFWVHGGSSNKLLAVYTEDKHGVTSSRVEIVAPAGAWKKHTISLAQLGNPPQLSRLSFHNGDAGDLTMFTLDEIRLDPTQKAGGVSHGFWNIMIPVITKGENR